MNPGSASTSGSEAVTPWTSALVSVPSPTPGAAPPGGPAAPGGPGPVSAPAPAAP